MYILAQDPPGLCISWYNELVLLEGNLPGELVWHGLLATHYPGLDAPVVGGGRGRGEGGGCQAGQEEGGGRHRGAVLGDYWGAGGTYLTFEGCRGLILPWRTSQPCYWVSGCPNCPKASHVTLKDVGNTKR